MPFGFGLPFYFAASGTGDGETFFLLLEDNNFLLLESNDIILLEAAP